MKREEIIEVLNKEATLEWDNNEKKYFPVIRHNSFESIADKIYAKKLTDEEKKYPKKIKEILKESPIAYGIVVLFDYNNKSVCANELSRRWQRDKKTILKNLLNPIKL